MITVKAIFVSFFLVILLCPYSSKAESFSSEDLEDRTDTLAFLEDLDDDDYDDGDVDNTDPPIKYDEELVRHAYIYAAVSYCTPFTSIRAWDCFWCNQTEKLKYPSLKNVQIIEGNRSESDLSLGFGPDILAYAGSDGSTVWVVFRGYHGAFTNWFSAQNKVVKKKLPSGFPRGARVHRGFYNAFNNMHWALEEGLMKAMEGCDGCRIIFTGHGFGGAVASIAGIFSEHSHPGKVGVITFGSPRTGNSKFATFFRDRIDPSYRIVNGKDNMVHYPGYYTWKFRHVPTEIWYEDGLEHRICNDHHGEDPTCSRSVPKLKRSNADNHRFMGMDLQSGMKHHCKYKFKSIRD